MSDTQTLRIVLPERRPAKVRDCSPGPSPFCSVPGLREAGDQAQECGEVGGEAIRGRGAVFTGLTRIVATVDKRLDKGIFRLPTPLDEARPSVTIEERVLDDLLDGIDVEATPRKARRARVH